MIALHAVAEGIAVELIGVDELLILHRGLEALEIVLQRDGEGVHGALHAVGGEERAGVAGHFAVVAVAYAVVIAVPRLNEVQMLVLVINGVFGQLRGVGIDETEVVPLVHGVIALHDLGILVDGDDLGSAEENADLHGAVDEVKGGFHSRRVAADHDGVFVFRKGLFPGNEEVSQIIPCFNVGGNFEAQLGRLIGGVHDEVLGAVVLLYRDGVQAAVGGLGQIPNLLGHRGVQVRRPLLQVRPDVGEQLVGNGHVEVVVPGAGVIHIEHFARLDGILQLVVGEILDVDFNAELLAADLVQLFENHRVVLRRGAAGAHGPGQLDHVVLSARERADGQNEHQSQYERCEFLHF